MIKPRLIISRKLPQEVEARAAQAFDVVFNRGDIPFDDADWAAADADALLVTVTDELGPARIASLSPRVRILANFGAGTSHIDSDAARARGIAVTNTPDVLTDATADIAMLLLLGAARRAGEGEALMRARRWTGWTPTHLLGRHLGGRRLGVFGMGRIGTATASRAAAFGMEVHYHGRRARDDLPFAATFHADPDEFLPVCDCISLHAALTAATDGWLNAARIARLPAGAIVVNTGRGELVDDDALVAALRDGHVAAAGLDVFRGEPAFDARYADLPNTFLLPHLGSATTSTRIAMGMRALDNLDAFFADGEPADRVA